MPYITSPWLRKMLEQRGMNPDDPELVSSLSQKGMYLGQQPTEGPAGWVKSAATGFGRGLANTAIGIADLPFDAFNAVSGGSWRPIEPLAPTATEQANPISSGLGSIGSFLIPFTGAAKALGRAGSLGRWLAEGEDLSTLASRGISTTEALGSAYQKANVAARGLSIEKAAALARESGWAEANPWLKEAAGWAATNAAPTPGLFASGAAGLTQRAVGSGLAMGLTSFVQPGTIEDRFKAALEGAWMGAGQGALAAPAGASRLVSAFQEGLGASLGPSPFETAIPGPLGGFLFGAVAGGLKTPHRTGTTPISEDAPAIAGQMPTANGILPKVKKIVGKAYAREMEQLQVGSRADAQRVEDNHAILEATAPESPAPPEVQQQIIETARGGPSPTGLIEDLVPKPYGTYRESQSAELNAIPPDEMAAGHPDVEAHPVPGDFGQPEAPVERPTIPGDAGLDFSARGQEPRGPAQEVGPIEEPDAPNLVSRTTFAAISPAHARFDRNLDTLVSDGTLSPADADFARTILAKAHGLLSRIGLKSDINLPYHGLASSAQGRTAITLRKGLSATNVAGKRLYASGATLFHELGHAGHRSLLSEAERAQFSQWFSSMSQAQREVLLRTGIKSELTPEHITAMASNEGEMFAQLFADYVFKGAARHPIVEPLLKRVFTSALRVFKNLTATQTDSPEVLNPFFEKLLGQKIEDVTVARSLINDMADARGLDISTPRRTGNPLFDYSTMEQWHAWLAARDVGDAATMDRIAAEVMQRAYKVQAGQLPAERAGDLAAIQEADSFDTGDLEREDKDLGLFDKGDEVGGKTTGASDFIEPMTLDKVGGLKLGEKVAPEAIARIVSERTGKDKGPKKAFALRESDRTKRITPTNGGTFYHLKDGGIAFEKGGEFYRVTDECAAGAAWIDAINRLDNLARNRTRENPKSEDIVSDFGMWAIQHPEFLKRRDAMMRDPRNVMSFSDFEMNVLWKQFVAERFTGESLSPRDRATRAMYARAFEALRAQGKDPTIMGDEVLDHIAMTKFSTGTGSEHRTFESRRWLLESLKEGGPTLSLDTPIGGDAEGGVVTAGEKLADKGPNPEQALQQSEAAQRLSSLVEAYKAGKLPPELKAKVEAAAAANPDLAAMLKGEEAAAPAAALAEAPAPTPEAAAAEATPAAPARPLTPGEERARKQAELAAAKAAYLADASVTVVEPAGPIDLAAAEAAAADGTTKLKNRRVTIVAPTAKAAEVGKKFGTASPEYNRAAWLASQGVSPSVFYRTVALRNKGVPKHIVEVELSGRAAPREIQRALELVYADHFRKGVDPAQVPPEILSRLNVRYGPEEAPATRPSRVKGEGKTATKSADPAAAAAKAAKAADAERAAAEKAHEREVAAQTRAHEKVMGGIVGKLKAKIAAYAKIQEQFATERDVASNIDTSKSGTIDKVGRYKRALRRMDEYAESLKRVAAEIAPLRKALTEAQALAETQHLSLSAKLGEKLEAIETAHANLHYDIIANREGASAKPSMEVKALRLARAVEGLHSPGIDPVDFQELPPDMAIAHTVSRVASPDFDNLASRDSATHRSNNARRFKDYLAGHELTEEFPLFSSATDQSTTNLSREALQKGLDRQFQGTATLKANYQYRAADGSTMRLWELTLASTGETYHFRTIDQAALFMDLWNKDARIAPRLDPVPTGVTIKSAPRVPTRSVVGSDGEAHGNVLRMENADGEGVIHEADPFDRDENPLPPIKPVSINNSWMGQKFRVAEAITLSVERQYAKLTGGKTLGLHSAFRRSMESYVHWREATGREIDTVTKLAAAEGIRVNRTTGRRLNEAAVAIDQEAYKIQCADGHAAALDALPTIRATAARDFGLSPQELSFLVKMDGWWGDMFTKLGLSAEHNVGYYTRLRRLSRNFTVENKIKDPLWEEFNNFWAANERQSKEGGDIGPDATAYASFSDKQHRDMLATLQHLGMSVETSNYWDDVAAYVRQGFRMKLMKEPVEDLQFLITRGDFAPTEGLRQTLERVVERFNGVPSRSERAANSRRASTMLSVASKLADLERHFQGSLPDAALGGLRRFYQSLGVRATEQQIRGIADTYTTWHRSSIFGLHIARTVRDMVTTHAFFIAPRFETSTFARGFSDVHFDSKARDGLTRRYIQLGALNDETFPAMAFEQVFKSMGERASEWTTRLYRNADVRSRLLATRCAELALDKAMPEFLSSANTDAAWSRFLARTGLDTHGGALDANEMAELRSMVRRGDKTGAFVRIARIHQDGAVFNYLHANSPQLYDSALGRLFGQYASWPINAVETMRWMATAPFKVHGDKSFAANRAMTVGLKYALAAEAAYSMGAYLGVDTSDWIPFLHNLTYTGGPGLTLVDKLKQIASGDPQMARMVEKNPSDVLFQIGRRAIPLPAYDTFRRTAGQFVRFADHTQKQWGFSPQQGDAYDRVWVAMGFNPFSHALTNYKEPFLRQWAGAPGRVVQDVASEATGGTLPPASKRKVKSWASGT